MTRRAWPDQLAALVLGVSLMALAWASVDAVRLTLDDDRPALDSAPVQMAVHDRDTTPLPDIGVAVSRNVFSPARRAPAIAYRLSAADPVAVTGMGNLERERIDPVVLGTALGANGTSFAMCSYDDAPAVVVRVGDRLGPYMVVAIARGRVVFRDVDGSRLEVESPTSPDGDLP